MFNPFSFELCLHNVKRMKSCTVFSDLIKTNAMESRNFWRNCFSECLIQLFPTFALICLSVRFLDYFLMKAKLFKHISRSSGFYVFIRLRFILSWLCSSYIIEYITRQREGNWLRLFKSKLCSPSISNAISFRAESLRGYFQFIPLQLPYILITTDE